jgi:hypothetical protein
LYAGLPKRLKKVFPSILKIRVVDNPGKVCPKVFGKEAQSCWQFHKNESYGSLEPEVLLPNNISIIHKELYFLVISAISEHYLSALGGQLVESSPTTESGQRIKAVAKASSQLSVMLIEEMKSLHPEGWEQMDLKFKNLNLNQSQIQNFMLAAYGQEYFCANSRKDLLKSTLLPQSTTFFQSTLLPLLN